MVAGDFDNGSELPVLDKDLIVGTFGKSIDTLGMGGRVRFAGFYTSDGPDRASTGPDFDNDPS